MTANTLALPKAVPGWDGIHARLGGIPRFIGEEGPVTAGPELGKLGLWIMAHGFHRRIWFQVRVRRSGRNERIELKPSSVTMRPAESTGNKWLIYGELEVPGSVAGDTPVYVLVEYELTNKPVKGFSHFSTDPFIKYRLPYEDTLKP